MEFRTQLPVQNPGFNIDHHHAICCMGSCFAEEIGARLAASKFSTLVNPFGILFDPTSICTGLIRLLKREPVRPQELFQNQDLWRHFDFHSRYAHPDKSRAEQLMNHSVEQGADFLAGTSILILTLGTAYVYFRQGKPVANCHKVPSGQFTRRKLETEEVADQLSATIRILTERRPDLKILLTVSPVRHLRDGLVDNQRSKAVLVLAAEQLERSFAAVHYFPAYELLLDDLRDYRFYGADMTHPSEQAVSYVWENFQAWYFSVQTRELVRRAGRLRAAMDHRPVHPETEEYRRFLRAELETIDEMSRRFPELDLSDERTFFTSRLDNLQNN
ncbi:MAG TPA: GSCFA domain-containing protein [Flavilitoribacter sp.]|nr:GSCFA domain-containing protein [Flavilitoribacter sp.]